MNLQKLNEIRDLAKEEFAAPELPAETTEEGELAVDVYQTKDSIIIKAPMAGVKPEDVDIDLSEEMVTVKGSRHEEREESLEHYYAQECYWGAFSRTVMLPVPVVTEKASATFTNGILTIKLPKTSQAKVKKLKVKVR